MAATCHQQPRLEPAGGDDRALRDPAASEASRSRSGSLHLLGIAVVLLGLYLVIWILLNQVDTVTAQLLLPLNPSS
jgi:hypothetical protein